MWAAPPAARPFFPLNSISILYTAVKPPQSRLRSLAVSVSSGTDNHEEEGEERQNVGVMGQAVLTAFKSKARGQQQQQKHKHEPKHEPSSSGVSVKPASNGSKKRGGRQQETIEQESEMDGPEKQLSGSDVLWALRKASDEKAKHLQQSKMKQKKRDINRQEEIKAVDDYHSVGSLRIKSEWDVRLAELEKRLEELTLMDV